VYAFETLRAAFIYRHSGDIALRRAALHAMFTAVQSFTRRELGYQQRGADKKKKRGGGGGVASSGVLSSLTSISLSDFSVDEDDEDSSGIPSHKESLLTPGEKEVIMSATGWILDDLQTEADTVCRVMKSEIISSVALCL
jgi:hypothetical protein